MKSKSFIQRWDCLDWLTCFCLSHYSMSSLEIDLSTPILTFQHVSPGCWMSPDGLTTAIRLIFGRPLNALLTRLFAVESALQKIPYHTRLTIIIPDCPKLMSHLQHQLSETKHDLYQDILGWWSEGFFLGRWHGWSTLEDERYMDPMIYFDANLDVRGPGVCFLGILGGGLGSLINPHIKFPQSFIKPILGKIIFITRLLVNQSHRDFKPTTKILNH